MDRSLVARQVTEALLLGDILLEPRSRGRWADRPRSSVMQEWPKNSLPVTS